MRWMAMAGPLSLLAGATAAHAGPAPAAPAAELPVCTTVTTVVRRGEVVLSASTQTKCESAEAAKAAGGGLHPAGALNSLLGGGGAGPLALTAKNARGFWSASIVGVEACRLMLMAESTPAGFRVKPMGCHGPLAALRAWTIDDGVVTLHAGGGTAFARLSGDRDHMDGTTAAGAALALRR